MGWSEARVRLIAPHFKIKQVCEAEFDEAGRCVSPGIHECVRSREAQPGERLKLQTISEWLAARKFRATKTDEHSADFDSHDMNLAAFFDDPNDIGDVQVEFRLNDRSVERVSAWEKFVAAVASDFRLRMVDAESCVVPVSAFRSVLASTWQWREFQRRNSWPNISPR